MSVGERLSDSLCGLNLESPIMGRFGIGKESEDEFSPHQLALTHTWLPDGSMPPHPDSTSRHAGHTPLLIDRSLSFPRCDSGPPYPMDVVARAGSGEHPPLPRGGPSLEEMGVAAYDLDACSDVKRKKVPGGLLQGAKVEEELCRICGDRASGYHYNALSCEGCKGFFRRSITKAAKYVCKYGGNCEMDMWMRRKCQACRLRRCREVGMKEECLLSEDQCKARDARRKSKQKTIKKEAASPEVDSSMMELDTASPSSNQSQPPPPPSGGHDNLLSLMPKVHREILTSLVILQEKFEFPDQQDVKEATEEIDMVKEVTAESLISTMTQMTVLITHLIVEFAKCLPGFSDLSRDDQIILIKAASSEVMTIRAYRCYDPETRAIVFASGQACLLEHMLASGLGHYAELVYKFCHNMALMQTDNAESALMTAIAIFSERPGLKEKELIEQLQAKYVDILQSYESVKQRHGGNALAKFLTRLSDLRSISAEHSNLLVDLQNAGTDLPSLMEELYIQPPEGT